MGSIPLPALNVRPVQQTNMLNSLAQLAAIKQAGIERQALEQRVQGEQIQNQLTGMQ